MTLGLEKKYQISLAIIIFGLLLGAISSYFSDYLSNVRIDSSSGGATFQYIIGVLWSIAIGIVILLLPIPASEKKSLTWLWTLRCFITLGVMIFYESTYSLDASLYYKDAILGHYYFSWSDFHGTNTVTALAALINSFLPIFDSYHAIKVIFSSIGLAGAWVFYKSFTLHSKSDLKLLWILALFPSSLFWSSILGKDPLTFFGLSLFTYGISKYYKRPELNSIFFVICGAFILTLVRFWLPIIFLGPALFTYIFNKSKQTHNNSVKYFSLFAFGVLFYLLASFFIQKVNLTNLIDTYERVNMMSRSWSSGGSSQSVPVFSSWIDIVKFIPIGAFTALFRPLPGEINNPFGIISGIENLFLLFFFVRSFYKLKVMSSESIYRFYILSTIFFWSTIYAFFSYQNLGTAVRFKLQILPFMLYIIHLGYKSKLEPSTDKK